MSLDLLLRSGLVWFGILALAISNAALREGVLNPMMGKAPALAMSGILVSILIFLVAFATVPWLRPGDPSGHVAVGVFWLALTLAFEFGLGRLVQGKPWSELFEAYAFKDGNLWPVVLAVVASSPYLAGKLRGLI